MRPKQVPAYAWIHAAEGAATSLCYDLWKMTRRERTRILLASLDALTSTDAAVKAAIGEAEYLVARQEALAAIREVLAKRKYRKKMNAQL